MKTYQSWLLGALACATIVPFTGCTKDEMVGPNGGDGETVKTEFAVMFSKGSKTKATNDEVGLGGDGGAAKFQGMTNIHLLGYSNSSLGSDLVSTNNFVSGDLTLNDNITLKPDMPEGATSDYKTKYNISLKPVNQSFMFYGESSMNFDNGTGVGKLTAVYPAVDTEVASKTTFTLTELEADGTEDENTDGSMDKYLTSVVQAAVTAVNTIADADVKTSKQNQLKEFFSRCTSPALYQIAHMLDQLYFNTTFWGTSTVSAEVQNAIKGSKLVFNTFEGIGAAEGGLLTISDASNVNKDNENYLGTLYPRGGKTLTISCDFVTPASSTVSFTDNPNTFYRPTSLYYMANSFLVTYTDYDNNLNWSNGTAAGADVGTVPVKLGTESPTKVALYNQIQYAVGQLLVNLKMPETLAGSNGESINATDIDINGIIIGKQKQAGWDFMPNGTAATDAAYDNTGCTNHATAQGGVYGTMRMLALPTGVNDPVVIALELVNNGKTAFEGANNGIVPAGATFYVTAELNPGSANASNKPANPAVFMSDYITTANLTLSSLKSAENTVPDLDDANLEFALSVDLDWKGGIEFNVPIE